MTGLEKIIDQIKQDASQTAAQNIEKARQEADAILRSAREQAERDTRLADEQMEQERQERMARAQSAAQLERRKRLLEAKQQLIQDIIAQAMQGLLKLPDEQYFSHVVRMVGKYALPKEGLLRFSQRDLDRLPRKFGASIRAVLPAGGKLDVSTEPAPIEGGFLLVYGGVEENCSFQALFEANRERLQDAVQELLFAE